MRIVSFRKLIDSGFQSGSFGTYTSTATFLLIFLLGNLVSKAQAPPSSDEYDLSRLQSQLSLLQNQIAAIKSQDENPFGQRTDRVRSVGSQRVKQAPSPTKSKELHIRLYDLSDLFAVSPHYPAVMPDDISTGIAMFQSSSNPMVGGSGGFGGGGFGGGGFGGGGMGGGGMGGGGGVFYVSPGPDGMPMPVQEPASLSMRAAQVTVPQLIKTIRSTVEPEEWGTGRDDAKLETLGNTLLITATEAMHVQINNLLNLFREHWGKRRTVSIQTFWIHSTPAMASELLDNETVQAVGAGVVSEKKWESFLANAKEQKSFFHSATLTGHNNQTLHALSGRQRQLVVGAAPFQRTRASMFFEHAEDVDPWGSEHDEEDSDMNTFTRTREVVGFQPIRHAFHEGTVVQMTPLATRGGNYVILDLHAKVNELADVEDGAVRPKIFVQNGDKGRSEVVLDHADFNSYRLNTTLRCPKDEVVLAGEMTYLGKNHDAEAPNLYLFVKASVHTIKEDESDWGQEEK